MASDDTRKLAVIYAAKSTEDKHGSIPTQIADARAMAEREGFTVVAEYSEDGRSAYRGSRGPKLVAAKEDAARRATEGAEVAIFVQHSDRIARGDGVEAKQVIQHVWESQADGYSFRSCQDDMTFTEQSGLMAFVMGLRNHEDSKRKSAATRAGLRRVAERGRRNGGVPNYGYRWEPGPVDADGKRRQKLVPDEATAPVVRRIVADYLAGAGVGVIAARLRDEGVPPPRSTWDRHTIANMLDNPVYVGRVRLNGEVVSDGEHEPLVDEATWQRVQHQRSGRKVVNGRPSGTSALLTGGLLRCGVCGAAMRARTPKDRQARYDCSTRHRSGGRVVCEMPGILASDVDDRLVRYLVDFVFDVDTTVRAMLDDHLKKLDEQRGLAVQALAEVTDYDEQLLRISADYRRNAITADEWHSLRDAILDDRLHATERHERLTAEADELAAEVDQEEARRLAAKRIAELRASLAAEVGERQGDVEAMRGVLARTFETITLVRVGDAVHLLPVVHEHMLRSLDPIDPNERVHSRPGKPKLQSAPGVHRVTART